MSDKEDLIAGAKSAFEIAEDEAFRDLAERLIELVSAAVRLLNIAAATKEFDLKERMDRAAAKARRAAP